MKTTNLILALFVTLLLMSCAKESNKGLKPVNVPKVVKTVLKTEYPAARDVRWGKEDEYYEAEFENKNQELEVVFEKDGSIVLTEYEIGAADLPEAITTYLNENYANVVVEESAKIVKADKKTLYEVVLEDGAGERELIFDEKGKLLEENVENVEDDIDY